MTFKPIIFSSPAEAVKAIYEMKQSNPSAIITIGLKCRDIDSHFLRYVFDVRITYKGNYAVKLHEGKVLFQDDDATYYPEMAKNRKVESITITSIQSVEPKLERGDKVVIVCQGRDHTEGTIVNPDDNGGYEVETLNAYYTFPSWKLIKLPHN